MQYISTPVRTLCIGQCASMASLLLAAGAPGQRRALPNSRVMVHQPRGGAGGTASDVAIAAREILALRARLDGLYAAHTGQPLEKVEAAMDRDTFMSPEQALEFGLLDEVIARRPAGDGLVHHLASGPSSSSPSPSATSPAAGPGAAAPGASAVGPQGQQQQQQGPGAGGGPGSGSGSDARLAHLQGLRENAGLEQGGPRSRSRGP